MKFEEALPKMRDEGRIVARNDMTYKLEDGTLWGQRKDKNDGKWYRVAFTGAALLEGSWTLLPIKVKKWQWVFGSDVEGESLPRLYLTEERAEAYRIEYEYDWMEPIDHTMIEEEE